MFGLDFLYLHFVLIDMHWFGLAKIKRLWLLFDFSLKICKALDLLFTHEHLVIPFENRHIGVNDAFLIVVAEADFIFRLFTVQSHTLLVIIEI